MLWETLNINVDVYVCLCAICMCIYINGYVYKVSVYMFWVVINMLFLAVTCGQKVGKPLLEESNQVPCGWSVVGKRKPEGEEASWRQGQVKGRSCMALEARIRTWILFKVNLTP